METSFETSLITKMHEATQETPFAGTPAQNFFIKWCKINDSIVPKFISREEWQQRREQGILEKNDQGEQILFLPEDLHPWEMVGVIETVDRDTFAGNPEKIEERAKQIRELGRIFEKAGLYLSGYLPALGEDEGKSIAKEIAQEFYNYGLSLQHREQRREGIPQESTLSDEDKAQLDEWFLGRDAYQKRMARLGENPTPEQIEETRKTLLKVYFKALSREGYKADGDEPWESGKVGPIQQLHERTIRQITKAIETPKREMRTAIFIRGLERLVMEMREAGWRKAVNDLLKKVGFDPLLEQRKLYDVLHIDKLKQELEVVRRTGDISKISAKELEIAKKIHRAVVSFPYDLYANNPSEMIKTQFINCVGSSILGGGLLDEVGIKYLHVSLPEHSATVLITSDGKAYWQDFTPGNLRENYTEITPDMVDDGMDLFDVKESGKTFNFIEWNPYDHVKGKLIVTLFPPEIGLQCHILNNTGVVLSDLGRYEEAIEAYQQAISFDLEYAYPYNGLGNALSDLGRNEEAIEAYRQAISIDREYAHPYNGLGNALSDLGRYEEAIKAYRQAISIDPKYADPYNGLGNALRNLGRYEEAIKAYRQAISIDREYAHPYNGLGDALSDLGRYEEAIKAYQKFIELWNGDEYWINRAKGEIEKLQNK